MWAGRVLLRIGTACKARCATILYSQEVYSKLSWSAIFSPPRFLPGQLSSAVHVAARAGWA